MRLGWDWKKKEKVVNGNGTKKKKTKQSRTRNNDNSKRKAMVIEPRWLTKRKIDGRQEQLKDDGKAKSQRRENFGIEGRGRSYEAGCGRENN